MKTLIDAYEAIAATSVVKDGRGNPTPPVLHRTARDIGKRAVVSAIPVLSTSVPVFQDARYRTSSGGLVVPHMVRFENEICLVGGINCPKKVVAIDSEGKSHAQLVKSNDDMRQDAVMQQVFGIANDLLRQDPATRKRTLSMVRYNVVPFSPSSGLVQWVNDTTPISEYLYGKAGGTGWRSARACYRECSLAMQDVADSRDLDKQRKEYEKCLQKFRPKMNRFFLENFLEPAVWFERRLAYTRSVAVSSIVGHIVGLGDRHLSNILIRNDTAEVVHIDLGIAFDQGQVLKYPERVPFRLTPNIVDGMGVCGLEGVMRRCCQETLRVLRLNRDSLMTVIEVFVHDPLYAWALSPIQALRKQAQEGRIDQEPRPPRGGGSDLGALGETADAQRVLQRVRRKLEGNEKGQILEVQGQVQHLFREAQSKDNLCQMYCGWGSWV
jgi:ataxia telangiectasia mutated family protein